MLDEIAAIFKGIGSYAAVSLVRVLIISAGEGSESGECAWAIGRPS